MTLFRYHNPWNLTRIPNGDIFRDANFYAMKNQFCPMNKLSIKWILEFEMLSVAITSFTLSTHVYRQKNKKGNKVTQKLLIIEVGNWKKEHLRYCLKEVGRHREREAGSWRYIYYLVQMKFDRKTRWSDKGSQGVMFSGRTVVDSGQLYNSQ
jgi:hypothetical protein